MANLINVSRTVITKIELGTREPTDEQLTVLSNKLGFDFYSFRMHIHNYKSLEHYLLASELLKCIKIHDINTISNIIQENKIFSELNYDAAQILKTYCETLVLIKLENNIDLAFNICLNFFKININDINKFKPKVAMPEQYYSMILNLGYCLSIKKDFENLLNLYNNTISFLEHLYFNDNLPSIGITNFYRKYYIICLNNLADTYFVFENYYDALYYCNRGIAFSNKLNILNVLPHLLKLKVEILCSENHYDDANETYLGFKILCQLTEKIKYFEDVTLTFKSKYPKLFLTKGL